MYEINPGNRIEQVLELPELTEIIQVFRENDHKLWICTRNGLFLYQNQTFRKFFSGQIVSSMTKDFEGGYWFTTLRNGVFYVPSFDVYERKPTDNKGKLNCISANDKKEIWIGSDRDDYYILYPNGQFDTHHLPSLTMHANEINNIRFFEGKTYIANKSFLTIIESNGDLKQYQLSLNDILCDDQFAYFGASSIFRVPKAEIDVVENYRFGTNRSFFGLSERYEYIRKRATVFCKGEPNEVWLGSNSGLYYLNYDNENLVFPTDAQERLNSNIQDLLYDKPNQLLFVASSSKGVLILKDKQIIKQLSKVNGLNSNSCNAVRKLPDNAYLIGTNNGLNLLSITGKDYRIKNLNAILGLKNKKINGIEFLDGIIYLIADKSLLSFDIRSINRRKILPVCHIENLSTNEVVATPGNYRFTYDNNDVSIKYIGISYIDQNLNYYYKLDGQHRWSTTKETQINYKSLSPGKYHFFVYCADSFGIKSRLCSISFEIEPPFWSETWFVIIAIVLFSLLLYWFVRYRLRLQRQRFETEKAIIQTERDKAQLEKEMIDLEQKALRLQMNPHFIFNALNTIKGYYSEGDNINASWYISKFSKLLRMLLENTDQSIPLAKEIEMLELYITLAQTRYKNKFTYELFVDDNLNRNETAIPTLLLQPIVENAIIHGLAPKEETGLLKVSFVKKGDTLECMIEDNGIGREASKTTQENKIYESKAIQITNERIAIFSENSGKASFEIIDLKHDLVSSGTKVIITIPLISIW